MTRARTLADLGSQSLATDAEATAAASAAAAAVPTGAKNLLYNGAMQVAQRGTSATGITASGYNTADRWRLIASSLGTWTETIEADAPAGFASSLKALCTTASASPSASAQLRYEQVLEGQDLQRIAKGTGSAQQLTISFWVKSNVTGTYIVWLYDSDNSRHVSGSYTVSASATWEQKSITFSADSTGAFTNDNNGSLIVSFGLAVGSDWSSGTLDTSWATMVNANRFVGQTNLAAATSNYWQITGVQLEVGDTATEFEHLPFGVELARCQRYYCKSYDYGTAPGSVVGQTAGLKYYQPATAGFQATVNIQFPVTMRTTPVVTFFNPNTGATGQARTDAGTTVAPGITYQNEAIAATYIVGATTWANAYSAYTASAEL